MAYGTPVLAYNGGGYQETVLPGKTGVLIDGTDTKMVVAGMKQIQKTKWDSVIIQKWAATFGRARFEKEVRKIVGV